jgi:hypothetical protein
LFLEDNQVTTEAAVAVATPQDDEAAFMAGYSATSGESAQETEPAAEKSAADTFVDEVNATEAAVPAEPAAIASVPDTLTPEEIVAMRAVAAHFGSVRQGLDKLSGTVGGMNRTLISLQDIQRQQPSGSPAAEGARKMEEAIKTAMEETVGEQYPELTPRLIEGLTKVFGATAQAAAPPIDVAAIEERLTASMGDRMERRLLARAHPNWEASLAEKDAQGQPIKAADGKYVPSESFVAWLGTKDESYRTTFMSTNDADFLSSALDDFKAAASPVPAPIPTPAPVASPAPAAPAVPAKTATKSRLAAAVVPTGTPGASPIPQLTEADAFELGFKAVRGT